MELRHLEHFVAVAEERHFTRAADLPYCAVLERELGAKLFVRTTRRVGLTDAGAVLGRPTTPMASTPVRR